MRTMKVVLLVSLMAGLAAASLTEVEINQKWDAFKVDFSKNYGDASEEKLRKDLFVKRLEQVEEHNKKYEQGLVTYKQGINKFADFTPEEMRPYTHGVLHTNKES